MGCPASPEQGLAERVDRFKEQMRTVAEAHHATWVDNEAALASAVDREALFLPDGRHRNAAGHRLLADALLPVLAGSATASSAAARAG